MNLLQNLPTWATAHPLIVHFPIALLFLAPLVWCFVIWRERRENSSQSEWLALATLWIGTVGMYLAVESGEAAGHAAPRMFHNLVEQHEEAAEAALAVAFAVTIFFSVMLVARRAGGPMFRWLEAARSTKLWAGSFFVARLVGELGLIALAILLVNAAHQGGQLVHVHGIRAAAASGQNPGAVINALERTGESKGDSDDD